MIKTIYQYSIAFALVLLGFAAVVGSVKFVLFLFANEYFLYILFGAFLIMCLRNVKESMFGEYKKEEE